MNYIKCIFFLLIVLTTFLFSCNTKDNVSENQNNSKEELKELILQKEDSLMLLQKENVKIPIEKKYELIHTLLNYYDVFPNDKYSPVCLDKVHMSYSALGVYHNAVKYADILIKKYPKYSNRPMILESQASNYDIFLEPRDTAKVRYYYTLLLKENPTINKDKKDGILKRLKHLDLSFNEYIDFMMKEVSIK